MGFSEDRRFGLLVPTQAEFAVNLSVVKPLTSFLRDRRGLASVEATILLATIGIALMAGGYAAGPAIKGYADRLTGLVVEARCLAAVPAGQPLPTNCPVAPD